MFNSRMVARLVLITFIISGLMAFENIPENYRGSKEHFNAAWMRIHHEAQNSKVNTGANLGVSALSKPAGGGKYQLA